ncbi:MAG: hypothetical protein ACRYFT_00880 [Janthinobacterium lividum]
MEKFNCKTSNFINFEKVDGLFTFFCVVKEVLWLLVFSLFDVSLSAEINASLNKNIH